MTDIPDVITYAT